MKLKTKIQLFSSLIMLILILLANTTIYFLFYKFSAESELDELSTQTNSIVETLQVNPDFPRVQLLKAFVPENGIIRVIDKENEEIIPTITKSLEFTKLPYAFLDREKRAIERDEEGHYIAIVSKPIIWEDGEIVTLQVADYLINLDSMMDTLLYVLIAASAIILIPTIIAGNLLSKFILQPIQQLIDTMKINIKEENWQTINVDNKSKDELYEMERTFNELISHLKESFIRQEQFVSDASHELKTPISIIKSYAELVRRRGEKHPELLAESIETIESEADRMQQLVNQLLELAKNKQAFPYQKMDLVPLAEKVYHVFEKAYEREIHLHITEENIFIEGNNEQIEQVLYILLSNAIKYSDKEIELKLYTNDQLAIIDVVDQGPGISEENQKRIFDRFYRVDKARTRKTGGTGLGLSIAKAIATAHGGTITITSEVGKGSTFSVQIPLMKNV